MSDTEARDEILDLRGLKCPLPALLARRTLLRAPTGTILAVIANDPLASIDVPHMCQREGFEVLAVEQDSTEIRITVRKARA